ncbi:hypothetical protein G9F72_006340 [Clostridium estertheticum]|uniref:hypothetical protein n=1 Tax=Clostridium estertheticum TaxID=238834 RepID=UPI0013E98A68|nr:hypothetical protein [Clostridium estertheticum]MBZ9685954.1 hypothetical protein [Clostridium estertheticum]
MKKRELLKVLSDLINRYLISTIDKSEMMEQLIGKISPSDVTEYEDELLNESFFTIYHINENYCDASNSELLYLRECLPNMICYWLFTMEKKMVHRDK